MMMITPRRPSTVRRSRLAAWWSARRAVRADLTLGEYLQARLDLYGSQRPVSQHPLPLVISVDGNRLEIHDNPHANDHPLQRLLDDPAGISSGLEQSETAQLRWLRATREAEAAYVMRRLGEAEEAASHVEAELADRRAIASAVTHSRDQSLADGTLSAQKTLSRSAKSRGRPANRYGLWIGYLLCERVFGVLAEAAQLGTAVFDAAGIDSSRLGQEWLRDPVGIVIWGSFACTASLGLFILADKAVALAFSLYETRETAWRNVLRWASLAAPVLALGALGMAIGGLRSAAGASGMELTAATSGVALGAADVHGSFMLLTLLMPFAFALRHYDFAAAREKENACLEARNLWDADEAQRQRERDGLDELVSLNDTAVANLERLREAAREELRTLNQRAQAAERELRDLVDSWRREAAEHAYSLVAAMTRDRLAFLLEAGRRGAGHLSSERDLRPNRDEQERSVWPAAASWMNMHAEQPIDPIVLSRNGHQ